VCRALGDTAAANRHLVALRFDPVARMSRPDQAQAAVRERIAAGDSAGAIAMARAIVAASVAEPEAHAVLANLLLARSMDDPDGVIEAYAARVLAPRDPGAWRRWAAIQANRNHDVEALASFETYFRLGGAVAAADAEAHRWVDRVRRLIPPGAAVREDAPQ
jgi:hypothetical protein